MAEPRAAGEDDPLSALVPPAPDPGRHVDDNTLLPRCTEWDKFHREDLSVTRTIAASPMTEELYDVCKFTLQAFPTLSLPSQG